MYVLNKVNILLVFTAISLSGCFADPLEIEDDIASYDSTVQAPFGNVEYRVYYPEDLTQETQLVHVSRGGTGVGDDRGKLAPYVKKLVGEGYVVLQVNHRWAGNSAQRIAQYRGEEISFIANQIVQGELNLGSITDKVDTSKQGYLGHSAGCMEGLAAGTKMTHGTYTVPEIKAVYCMSPAGYQPDQFGIYQDPSGFSYINNTAVFLVIGQEEINFNGVNTFMSEGWRLQGLNAMNTNGSRIQAVIQGENTDHMDVRGVNKDIKQYNLANSVALFNTHLRSQGNGKNIGRLQKPPNNNISLTTK